MSVGALIFLFILLLAISIAIFIIAINNLNTIGMIIGVIAITISFIPLVVADGIEQKRIEDSIRERCSDVQGIIVEHEETKWDVATKTNKTTIELYCLKDGQLSK